jgi:tRNA-splicing ligase RtcB
MNMQVIGRPERPVRVPIKVWASVVEDGAIEQAVNLANLPFAIDHVALMPDAHQGYGMPIGGVLFADKVIVPYAVGVDIGCGVSLTATQLSVANLDGRLQALLDGIAAQVPVGNGPGAQFDDEHNAFDWVKTAGYEVSDVLIDAIEAAETQLGTLGGGNHFIEVQADEDDRVYVMLHSGSRSVGKKVCDHWHKVASGLNRQWFSDLPHPELAYLPWDTDEARGYFADMSVAMAWAEQNRAAMRTAVEDVLNGMFDEAAYPHLITDIHHNYAAWENHRGRNGLVHRKGAVRARQGEVVLIPGSMGTASYVGEGLGNADSFETCQHGAGRARGRNETKRLQTAEQFTASMTGVLLGGKASEARDEGPFAYKDIETVMADSADLVRPVTRLRPLGVVKG